MTRFVTLLALLALDACATAPPPPGVIAVGPREVTIAELVRNQSVHRGGTWRLGGAPELRPSSVSDDGSVVTIEWPPEVDLPAVFAVNAQGNEFLPLTMMRADRMVVDAIYPKLVFRIDGRSAWARRVISRRSE